MTANGFNHLISLATLPKIKGVTDSCVQQLIYRYPATDDNWMLEACNDL